LRNADACPAARATNPGFGVGTGRVHQRVSRL